MNARQPPLFPDVTAEKICSRCKKLKPLAEFHKWSAAQDGHVAYCKQCKNNYDRGYYQTNCEKIKRQVQEYRETERGLEVKRRGARKYGRSEKGKQNRRRHYQTETFKKTRAKYLSRPDVKERDRKCKRRYDKSERGRLIKRRWGRSEKHKAQRRKQYALNPWPRRIAAIRRKARKNNVPGQFTKDEIEQIFQSQDGICVYCDLNPNCGLDLADGFHIDHIIPLSRQELNPTNWTDNIQLLCAHCNTSKHSKTHDEYIEWLQIVYS